MRRSGYDKGTRASPLTSLNKDDVCPTAPPTILNPQDAGNHINRLQGEGRAIAVPCHWPVENRLHWVLDVVFHEDLSRLRSAAGPQNMATVRHMAMNLLRAPKDKHSLKLRRKSAAWDTAYLAALLRQSA